MWVDLLVVPEQAVLFLTNLDGAATKLRDQDLVARLHADGNAVSALVERARANGQHLGLVQLLDGGVGQEDARCGLGLRLDALHEHAVEKGGERADGLEDRLRAMLASAHLVVDVAPEIWGAGWARRWPLRSCRRDDVPC